MHTPGPFLPHDKIGQPYRQGGVFSAQQFNLDLQKTCGSALCRAESAREVRERMPMKLDKRAHSAEHHENGDAEGLKHTAVR
jgi:hypothetical protein